MPVKGDEVADRIEERIREAVDRMMGEIHTSIQDVRKAIEQQLDAAVQSVQADVKGFTFRSHLEEGIRELEESLTSEVPQPPATPDARALRAAVRSIESGKNQVEVLTALLEQCLHYGSRSAMMILKDETFTGWKAAGFSAHGGSDEQMKRFAANRDGAPQFDALLRDERAIEWDGKNLAERFGVTPSSRALLMPMVIKDKVAAAVYVDAVPEDASRFDRPSLELLVFTTGLLIDTLAIRKKSPSPTLSEDDASADAKQPAATPRQPDAQPPQPAGNEFTGEQTVAIRYPNFTPGASPADTPEPPPRPSRPDSEPEVRPDSEPAVEVSQDEPSRSFHIDTSPSEPQPVEEPAPRDESSSYSTSMFRTVEPDSAPEPAQPQEPPPAPEPTSETSSDSQPDPSERPSTQYVPPPGIERGAAFSARNSDERRHEEARRFARLLVSEIKLYNESKVEQGRRERDIYERLKEDIDRSRQMYDDRIPEDVRNGTNYFYEELVRILADGDREALGL